MKNSFYLPKRIFLQHQFDNGISQLTNQNSDQSKFKLTLTNQNLNSLSMWRVYNFTSHKRVYILSCKHASRPIRARVLSLIVILQNLIVARNKSIITCHTIGNWLKGINFNFTYGQNFTSTRYYNRNITTNY